MMLRPHRRLSFACGALLALAVSSSVALAQGGPGGGGPGGPGGGGNEQLTGMLGVAVVMPAGTQRTRLVAQRADQSDGVAFTDDGSLVLDMPGDGEWWALLNPSMGSTTVHVSGVADGQRVWHTETITVPRAWQQSNYPVTLLATRGADGWTLRRSLAAVMPEPAPTSGSGLSSRSERAGIPAPVFYLGFAFIAFLLAATGALRSAILASRR